MKTANYFKIIEQSWLLDKILKKILTLPFNTLLQKWFEHIFDNFFIIEQSWLLDEILKKILTLPLNTLLQKWFEHVCQSIDSSVGDTWGQ